jgi:hypothetical protein
MRRFQQILFHYFWSYILFSMNFQTSEMDKYKQNCYMLLLFTARCMPSVNSHGRL